MKKEKKKEPTLEHLLRTMSHHNISLNSWGGICMTKATPQ
jgi:hypothetical protein